MTTIAIVGGVIVLIGLWAMMTINGFRSKEIKVDEGLSGIEVALTKRYDLLTKLLNATKGYMKHEKEVFSEVVNLRNQMTANMSIEQMNTAEKQMGSMFSRLFAVAEEYPQLRSSNVFIELQRGMQDAEEHLQAARRLYNVNVTSYNTAIAMIPASLLAGGRQAKVFFEAESHKRADVEMTF